MNNTTTLAEALAFHGHQCWASTAGVRLGLAGMEALGAPRSGAKQLHAIIEIGDHHGGMCFGDRIQFTTGCTLDRGLPEPGPAGRPRAVGEGVPWIDARGMTDELLVEGVHRSTMAELTAWTIWADKVITF